MGVENMLYQLPFHMEYFPTKLAFASRINYQFNNYCIACKLAC